MKIAFLTSGILPVPAIQGGAVENFLDFFLEYNNIHQKHDITIYSVYVPKIEHHPALNSKVNHYHFIRTDSFISKIRKTIYKFFLKDTYHHYSIENFLQESLKHIKKCRYDILVLNNRPGYAETLTGKIDAKLVYNLYNDKLNNTTRSHQKIYDAASLIISTSNYITNRVKTINDVANKCITIYSGIELKNFTQNRSSSFSRDDIGLSIKDFVLIFSGRLTAEKGIYELVSAIKALKQHSDIKLMIIGSSFYGNTNKEDSFIHNLKEISEDIKDQIIFTGFIPYDQIPNYLKISDVAVIPSVWDDPFPTTVLEAQAMGLPIIATRRGGIPEEVTEKNAILLETNEHFIDNLRTSILDLYQHPERRKQMSEVSIERSKLFDKETYAQNFFAALENI